MSPKKAVAFLDILGFKEMIANLSTDELAEEYTRIISVTEAFNKDLIQQHSEPQLVPSLEPGKNWCIKRVFSDSIILIANDESEESCLRLLLYTWKLMQACLSFQMPFRGGIAYDEIYVNEAQEIFLGKALTKAFELESSQDWIGVAIHKELSKHYKNIFNGSIHPVLSNIFLQYLVPFKGGGRKELNTINWRFNLIVEKGTRSLMPYSNNKDVIEKITNTLEYAKHVVDSGQIYVYNQSELPIEVRSFWCGGKEPPFPHGDDL